MTPPREAAPGRLPQPGTWDLGRFGVRTTLNVLDPDGVMIQFVEMTHSTVSEP